MRLVRLVLVPTLALLGVLFFTSRDAYAQCAYTVDGTIRVEHQLSELRALGATSPLEGIQVRVQSRSRVLGVWGTWATWDVDVTDADGWFSLTRSMGCGAHQVRVHVKFQDDDLEIRHEHSTSSTTKVLWYLAYLS
jgi:hypothetical protein